MSENFQTVNPSGDVVVPFSDDEAVRDDELIVEDKPGDSPQVRQERLEKRRSRAAERERERKEQAEELKTLRERDEKREREMAELRGAIQQPRQPRAAGPDPIQARLDQLYEDQNQAYLAANAEVKAGTFDEKRGKHYEQLARKIEAEKSELYARKAIRDTEPQRQASQARSVWEQKYPEVYNNPAAYQYAESKTKMRMAKGESGTAELVDEVMNETLVEFKLRKPAPTRNEREKLSGTASHGSAGSNSAPSGIVMTKEFRKMAVAKYSDLPEAEAIKKWINTEGKALREKKIL